MYIKLLVGVFVYESG